MDRRDFVKLLLAGGATSLAACTRAPAEKLVSPLDVPEELVPGRWLEYASVCRECSAGCGLLVRTREARAIKLEGIPEHPVNRGALCARGQSALQGLYDPNRVRQPLRRGPDGSFGPISWDEAEDLLVSELRQLRSEGRARQLAIISSQLGPTLRHLTRTFADAFGAAGLWEYEPFAYEPLRAANRICFGRDGLWRLRLERARLVLCLGADFLGTWLSPVEQARGYAELRRYRDGELGTHVQLEPRLSLSGANADEWLPIRPGSEYALAMALLRHALDDDPERYLPADVVDGLARLARPFTVERVAELTGLSPAGISHLARTFSRTRPAVALPVGTASSGTTATAAHVAVALLNAATGNFGVTVELVESPGSAGLATHAEVGELITLMADGEIAVLIVHDANPSFTLPSASGWTEAIGRVRLVIAFATTLDETASQADLVLPLSTPLESWGDWEARAGIRGLQQPCMRPLHDTRLLGDVLLRVGQRLGDGLAAALPWASFHDCLRDRWTAVWEAASEGEPFDAFWTRALQRGGLWFAAGPIPAALSRQLLDGGWLPRPHGIAGGARSAEAARPSEPAFELLVFPSLHHHHGRTPHRPWLQEIPDPISQVAWGPWAELHPDAARALGIREGELVAVRSPHGELSVPARLNRWIRRDVVALPLGHRCRDPGGTAGRSASTAVELLGWTIDESSGGLLWLSQRVAVEPLATDGQLIVPRGAASQEQRRIAQAVRLDQLRRGTSPAETPERPALPDLYPPHEHPVHRWGMVIDTHACIGCNACAVACYAENNIPVVGPEQMALGREMAWLRLEVYDDGEERPDLRFLPMLCQQCDNAPCEPVCPVTATYHNPEGLNAQIYNRCVGTRYCSHNCPYKVRRFNWLQPRFPEPINLQLNPEVTVRDAGVMEKCTFCVQRIYEAKRRARSAGRELRDGDVVPACAQTCPTGAIRFGDAKDPESQVSRRARDPRAYVVLEHLNTRPAIVYLKKITV